MKDFDQMDTNPESIFAAKDLQDNFKMLNTIKKVDKELVTDEEVMFAGNKNLFIPSKALQPGFDKNGLKNDCHLGIFDHQTPKVTFINEFDTNRNKILSIKNRRLNKEVVNFNETKYEISNLSNDHNRIKINSKNKVQDIFSKISNRIKTKLNSDKEVFVNNN